VILAALMDTQRANVEEADQEQHQERHGHEVPAARGDCHRRREVASHQELDVGDDGLHGAIPLLRPAQVVLRGDACLGVRTKSVSLPSRASNTARVWLIRGRYRRRSSAADSGAR